MKEVKIINKSFKTGCDGRACPLKKHCKRYLNKQSYPRIMTDTPYKTTLDGVSCLFFA